MDDVAEQVDVTKQAIKLKKEKVIRGIVLPACSGGAVTLKKA